VYKESNRKKIMTKIMTTGNRENSNENTAKCMISEIATNLDKMNQIKYY